MHVGRFKYINTRCGEHEVWRRIARGERIPAWIRRPWGGQIHIVDTDSLPPWRIQRHVQRVPQVARIVEHSVAAAHGFRTLASRIEDKAKPRREIGVAWGGVAQSREARIAGEGQSGRCILVNRADCARVELRYVEL